MHGRHLYEYAVIRVVPVVEREEFVNAGIILFCKSAGRIIAQVALNETRLRCFNDELDLDQVRLNLRAFEQIAQGVVAGGPIALLDAPSRFRWLTATRSSAIQTSRPHPGLCDDLDATAKRLFFELVG